MLYTICSIVCIHRNISHYSNWLTLIPLYSSRGGGPFGTGRLQSEDDISAMEKALLYATNTLKEEALTAASSTATTSTATTTASTSAAVGGSNVVSKAERVNTNAPPAPTPVRAAEESRPLPPLKKGMNMLSILFI